MIPFEGCSRDNRPTAEARTSVCPGPQLAFAAHRRYGGAITKMVVVMGLAAAVAVACAMMLAGVRRVGRHEEWRARQERWRVEQDAGPSIQVNSSDRAFPEEFDQLPFVPGGIVGISMDESSLEVRVPDGAGGEMSVQLAAPRPAPVCDTVESAVAEAIVQFRRKFEEKEPSLPSPGLVVIKQAANGWLTRKQLDLVESALSQRGIDNEVVFNADAAGLSETYYEIELERNGTAKGGALDAFCRVYFPEDKIRTLRYRISAMGSPRCPR